MDSKDLLIEIVTDFNNSIGKSLNQTVNAIFSATNKLEKRGLSISSDMLVRGLRDYLRKKNVLSIELDNELLLTIGTLSTNRNRFEVSLPILQELYQRCIDNPTYLVDSQPDIFIRLGSAYIGAKKYTSAEDAFRKAIEASKSNENKIQLAHAENNLALTLILAFCGGAEVMSLLESSYSIRKAELGEYNLDTIATKINIISVKYASNKCKQAIVSMEELAEQIVENVHLKAIEYPNACSLIAEWSIEQKDFTKAIKYLDLEIAALTCFGAAGLPRIETAELKRFYAKSESERQH